jgi:DNA phosphorothioation-dependent restriction protein DptF
MGEAGTIVGGHIDRNNLRQGLYVSTEEDKLVKSFFVDDYTEDGDLLIITGSAGDGKSALLSRAFRLAQEKGIDSLTEADIHMDATASTQKTKTYDETLSEFFDTAIQRINAGEGPRSGVAINLGLAIDFFERKGKKKEYHEIWDAIEGAKPQRINKQGAIKVLNLSHRQLFRTHPEHFGEGLLREIVDKFDGSNPKSPFYDAFQFEKEECSSGEDCPLCYNMERFTDKKVRANITRLLAAKSLIENSYLNPRRILDYLASILLPPTLESIAEEDSICPIGHSVEAGGRVIPKMIIWNSVFQIIDNHEGERSGKLDPSAQSEKEIDLKILKWAANPSTVNRLLEKHPSIINFSIQGKIQTAIRKQYLEGKHREHIRTAIEWSWFVDFLGAYTYLNRDTSVDLDHQVENDLKKYAVNMNQTLTGALKGWSGKHTEGNYIEFVDGIKTTDYRFLAQWSNPSPNRGKSRERTKRETTPGQLWFVLEPEQASTEVPIPISFELYVLMKRISMGYNPNVRDLERSEGIRLIHSRLSEFTDKQNSVRIVDKNGEELLSVEKGAFDGIEIRGKN